MIYPFVLLEISPTCGQSLRCGFIFYICSQGSSSTKHCIFQIGLVLKMSQQSDDIEGNDPGVPLPDHLIALMRNKLPAI